MKSQLTPLEPPYSKAIGDALSKYPQQDGYLLKLFRVFANSPRFLLGKGVVNLLDKESPISLKEREIVILRVCANNHCEYEWGVHVSIFADKAGLSTQQVEVTRSQNASDECWSSKEQLLIQVVDQLCEQSSLQQQTKEEFQACWSIEQQLEILALCGNYHTISFVANAAELSPEPFAARFP